MRTRFADRRRGFTRADLTVGVVLAALAVGLMLPAVSRAWQASSRTRSANNLKEIGQAMRQHVGAFGFFPGNGGPPMEAVTTPDVRTGFPDSEKFRWGYGDPKRAGRLQTGCWAYAILPYIGEEKAFRTQDHTRAVPLYYVTARREVRAYNVPKIDPIYAKWSYQDAGLGPWGRTDYAANDQVILGGFSNVMKPAQVTDGLSATALAAEKAMDTRAVRAGGWYWDEPIILGGSGGTGRKGSRLLRDSPTMLEDAADNWGSPDAAGVQFLFCDGHVRLFGYSTEQKIVAAVISPGGGEDVDLD
jgi:prepilin-type processing-associated H-X9-DG protein